MHCETNRPSGPMGLSAVSVLVVAQSSSEIPEGLMNNPVYTEWDIGCETCDRVSNPGR